MSAPTPYEKAMLAATCAAGIMASHEAWRAFEHEESGETFEEWAVVRGFLMARSIFERIDFGENE